MGTKSKTVNPIVTNNTWKKDFRQNGILYLIFIPVAAYFIIFHYLPMVGILMSFEDYKVAKGLFGSTWVGFANFKDLFTGETYLLVMRNTVCMALLNLTLGFIFPIGLAIILSEVRWKPFKRTVQTISYMPYFVATVVVCQLISEFLGRNGTITLLLSSLGLERQNWLANPNVPVFWLINAFTDIWQGCGYGAIVYIAAISNVNGDFHEAAAIDGANRFKRITKITIPCVLPLIIMFLTLRIGLVFVVGFDKVLLLYMPTTYATADCLSTYTYRMAFGSQINYGLSAASGLFQSVVGTILLLTSNKLNRKANNMTLF